MYDTGVIREYLLMVCHLRDDSSTHLNQSLVSTRMTQALRDGCVDI